MKYNSKVDANQKTIVAALRMCGAVVKHVHSIKRLFDIIVFFDGKVYCVEIKTDSKKKLTPGEIECKTDLESVGVKYWIITSIDEALEMIKI